MLKKTLMISGIATVVTLLAACAGGNDDSAANSAAGADDSDGFAQVKAAGQEPETKPGGDNRASGDARTHMCKLISADEVSAIIGEPMRNGKESFQASGKLSISDCLWLADGESSAGVLQRKSTNKDADATFELARKESGGAVDVKGLGDKAFFAASMGQLNILDGDSWFIVTARKDRESRNLEMELTDRVMQLGELVARKY